MALSKNSIVDYLKSSGKDSSYESRKKLAAQYGVNNYSGTAAQNTTLLNRLQSGSGNTPQQPNNNLPVVTPVNEVKSPTSGGSTAQSQQSQQNRVSSYAPSSTVQDYRDRVQDYEDNEPDKFSSRYDGQIQSILDSILNREKFEYDMNNDQLYQQYKDSYMRQGNLAMRDTMGNAAALSGGYGNTYAQTAGSQAYDNYMAQLNDKIPELYQLAYNQYLNEGNEMYNQLGAVTGLDNTDYSRYRDTVNDYYTNRDYYNNRYNQEYGYDYGQHQDALSQQNWQDQFGYQQAQDALAQQNWREQFEYQKEQDALQLALAKQKAASSGGSKSSKSKKEKELGGYAPVAAGIIAQIEKNNWSNAQAYDYMLKLGNEGQIKFDEFDDILKMVGINENEALEEREQMITELGKDQMWENAGLKYLNRR